MNRALVAAFLLAAAWSAEAAPQDEPTYVVTINARGLS